MCISRFLNAIRKYHSMMANCSSSTHTSIRLHFNTYKFSLKWLNLITYYMFKVTLGLSLTRAVKFQFYCWSFFFQNMLSEFNIYLTFFAAPAFWKQLLSLYPFRHLSHRYTDNLIFCSVTNLLCFIFSYW